MFARFRQARDRLNVSIVEAARAGAKVRQNHVASLGSVPLSPSPADRVRFWIKAKQRLGKFCHGSSKQVRTTSQQALYMQRPLRPTGLGALPWYNEHPLRPGAALRHNCSAIGGILHAVHTAEESL